MSKKRSNFFLYFYCNSEKRNTLKKRSKLAGVILFLVVVLLSFIAPALNLYENYGTQNAPYSLYGNLELAQQFTVGNISTNEAYVIKNVTFALRRVGNLTENLVSSLYAVNASGQPTGSVLSNGTIAHSSLPTTLQLFNITMSDYTLQPSTQYILVLSTQGKTGDVSNYFAVGFHNAGTYAGGYALSGTSGAGWTSYGTIDLLFYVYGDNSTSDAISPTYSLNQTNGTFAGGSTLFSLYVNDATALHNNGYYIFSTNNTGVWANDSAVNFTSTPSWANVTKVLNSTVGTSVGYRWYITDNVGNVNNTEVYNLTTTVQVIYPTITFVSPTPSNHTFTASNSTYLNATITSDTDTSAWFDWNRSLVAYYAFDFYNTTGIYDNSSYKRFAVFNGTLDTGDIISGKRGDALDFDREVGSYLRIGEVVPTNAYTKSMWIYMKNQTVATEYNLLSGDIEAGGHAFWVPGFLDSSFCSNTSGVAWAVRAGHNNDWCSVISDTAVTLNTWIHVAVTYDSNATTMKIYVNGVLEDTNTSVASFNDTTGQIAGFVGGNRWNGSLDEVLLFNRALSDDEIKSLYNSSQYGLKNNFTNLTERVFYNYTTYTIDQDGDFNDSINRSVSYSQIYFIAFGDSITYGYGLPNITTQRWGYLTSQNLSLPLVNVGSNGADVSDEMQNYISNISNYHQNSTVVFMGGTNDIINNVSEVNFKGNYSILIQTALTYGYDNDSIYLTSIPWSNQTGYEENIDQYSQWVYEVSQTNLVKFINMSAFLKDHEEYLQSDGIHPDEQGHAVISNVVSYYILNSELPPIVDAISPTYSLNQTNGTFAGGSTLFSLYVNDATALHNNGYYIFSTNNTGVWANDSAVNFTSTPSWANVTKVLNSTVGTSVGYRWYITDNVGNVNNTEVYNLTVSQVSVSYLSGSSFITPYFPNLTSNLTCNISGASSSVANLTAYYTWFLDGVQNNSGSLSIQNSSSNSTTINFQNLSLGDVWTCKVLINDGTSNVTLNNVSSLVRRSVSINNTIMGWVSEAGYPSWGRIMNSSFFENGNITSSYLGESVSGSYVDFAYDPLGNLNAIFLSDTDNQTHIYNYQNNSWYSDSVLSTGWDQKSVAVDRYGSYVMAVIKSNTSSSPYYATSLNGGITWSAVQQIGLSTVNCSSSTQGINFKYLSDGTGLSVCTDSANNFVYYHWDGLTWDKVGTVMTSLGTQPVQKFDIGVMSNANAFILVSVNSVSNDPVYVVRWNGSNITSSTLIDNSSVQVQSGQLALDCSVNDKCFVIYRDSGYSPEYSIYNGTNWSTSVALSSFVYNSVSDNYLMSVVVDDNDVALFNYLYEGNLEARLGVIKLDGSFYYIPTDVSHRYNVIGGPTLSFVAEDFTSYPPYNISSSVVPISPTTLQDLIGNCRAYDSDSNITYYWKWYVNSTLNSTGLTAQNYSSGTSVNVANISNINTSLGEVWVLSCLASDGNINSSWVNSSVTIGLGDIISPIFTSIPANASLSYGNESLGVEFDATDETSFGTFSVNDTRFLINSTGWLSNNSILSFGVYELNISINDSIGNLNSTRYKVTVNKNTGSCSVYFNTTSPQNSSAQFIVYTNCTSNYTLTRNGTVIDNASTQSLNSGTWNFTVQRNDTYNYSIFNDTQFFVINADIYSPQVTLVSPSNGSTLTSATVSFSITTDENSTCNYSLNSFATNNSMTTDSNGISHTSTSTLSNGNYLVNYSCVDVNGNINKSVGSNFSVSVSSGTVDTGGGGGGGGGTPTTSTYTLNVSNINLDIEAYSMIKYSISVRNTGTSALNLSTSQKSLTGKLSVPEGNISISPGETRVLQFTFRAGNLTGIYTGILYIGSKSIPVSLNVIDSTLLFDSNIVVLNKEYIVRQGDKLKTSVELIPMGSPAALDVTLNYAIKNYNGSVFLTRSETVYVEERVKFDRDFDTGILPVGEYIVSLELVYPNGVAPSSAHLQVIEFVPTSMFGKVVFYLVNAILIVLVAIIGIVVYNIVNRARSQKP